MDERIEKQLAFALEIDKVKNVFRQTHLSGNGRNENDAGDTYTYAYDVEAMQTQKAREDAAKERIFSILPDDQKVKLISLFDEFEAYETSESKFAHAMDNLQPLILNNSNSGGDWKEHGVTSEKIYKRQIKTRLGSEKLFAISDDIIQENIRNGNLEK